MLAVEEGLLSVDATREARRYHLAWFQSHDKHFQTGALRREELFCAPPAFGRYRPCFEEECP